MRSQRDSVRMCVFYVASVRVMNNLWVACLIDVGYKVSSQPVEGLCARAQTLNTLLNRLQKVWFGIGHKQTQSHTHTYVTATVSDAKIQSNTFAFTCFGHDEHTCHILYCMCRITHGWMYTGQRVSTSCAPKQEHTGCSVLDGGSGVLGGGKPGFPHLCLQQ